MGCELIVHDGKNYTPEEFKEALKNGLLQDLINEGKVDELSSIPKKKLTASQKMILDHFDNLIKSNNSKDPSTFIYNQYLDKLKRELLFRNPNIADADKVARETILDPYLKNNEGLRKILEAKADNVVTNYEVQNIGSKRGSDDLTGVNRSRTPIFDYGKQFTDEAWQEKQLEYAKNNEQVIKDMVDKVSESPRALNPDEVINVLALKKAQENTVQDLQKQLNSLDKKHEDYKVTENKLSEALAKEEDFLVKIHLFTLAAGTKNGQALALFKKLLTNDFEFSKEAAKEQIAKGEPLSKADIERLKRLEKRYKDIEERLAEIEKEKQHTKNLEGIQNLINKRKYSKKSSEDTSEATGKKTTAKTTEKETTDNEGETKSREPYIDEDGKLQIPKSYVMDHIDNGVTDAEELFDVIQKDLSDKGLNVDQRDITDAISKYGEQKEYTPEERDKAFSEAKRIAGLISKIDDAKQGIKPFKLSRSKEAPKVRERELRKQLNELMKQFDITPDEAEGKKLKSRLDSYKTRLKNKIEDVQKVLDTYKSEGIIKENKTTSEQLKLDQEAKDLQERLKFLKDDLKAIKDAEGISSQEALAEVLDRMSKQIERYDEKIQTGDTQLQNAPKEKLYNEKSAEFKAKYNELQERKKAFNEMRKANSEWAKTQEGKKEAQAIATAQKTNDKLQFDLDNAEKTNYKSIGYTQKEVKSISAERQAILDERKSIQEERQQLRDELGLTDVENLRRLKERTSKSIEAAKARLKEIGDLGKDSVIGKDTDLKGNPKPDVFHTKEEMESAGKDWSRVEIEGAIINKTFLNAINNGEISAADAVRILDSYEINIPVSIQKLYMKDAKAFEVPKKEKKNIELDQEARELKLEQEEIKLAQKKKLEDIEDAKQSILQKKIKQIGNFLGLARIMQTAGDISTVGIQGALVMARMPITLMNNRKLAKEQFKAIVQTGKLTYATSSKNLESEYHSMLQEMKDDPDYELAKESKLKLQGDTKEAEEHFSNWVATKIPFLGDTVLGFTEKTAETSQANRHGLRIFKRSELAANIYIDKIRFDLFKKHKQDLINQNVDLNTPQGRELLKHVADFVNTGTGGASLGKLEQNSRTLGGFLYSARMISSKFKTSSPYAIYYYAKLPPEVRSIMRKEVMKTLAGSAITLSLVTATILAYAKGNPGDEEEEREFNLRADKDLLIGNSQASINFNPKSTDFLKAKIGKETYGFLGGYEQVMKMICQVIAGEKYNKEGYLIDLKAGNSRDTPQDVLVDFFLNKTSPVVSTTLKELNRRRTEKPKSLKEKAFELYTPFPVQATRDILMQPKDENSEEQNTAKKTVYTALKIIAISLGTQSGVSKDFEKYTKEELAKIKEEAPMTKQNQEYERGVRHRKIRLTSGRSGSRSASRSSGRSSSR